jgi:GNAT superfamily N-acetyltransferase
MTSAGVASVRRFEPGDLGGVMELVAACYGDEMADRGRWSHWHLGHPGARHGTMVAEDKGRIIGVQPMEMFAFQLGGEALLGGVLTGAMVHPDRRRLGIFDRLLEACEARAWEVGADFVTTMPNDFSYPGFLRRGYCDPGERMLFVLALAPGAIVRRSVGRVPLLGGFASLVAQVLAKPRRLDRLWQVTLTERSEIDDQIGIVAERVAASWPGLIQCRNAAWLLWRFARETGREYRFFAAEGCHDGSAKAFVVATREHRFGIEVGYLVDLFGIEPSATAGVVASACRVLRGDGVHLALAVVSCAELIAPLRAAGFRRVPSRIAPKRFRTVYRSRPGHEERLAALSSINHWYQTLGDWDTV